MLLSSISWNDRINLIEGVLADVLAGLASKAPTALVTERVMKALGAEDKQSVAAILIKMAPKHPLAKHEGGTFKAWGRENRRWVWSPGDSTGWSFFTAQGIPETPAAVQRGASAPLAGMSDIDSGFLLDELALLQGKAPGMTGEEMRVVLIKLVEDARDAEPYDPDDIDETEITAEDEPNADDIFG